jgi:hypothetical protein
MAIEGEIYPTYFYKDKFKHSILVILFLGYHLTAVRESAQVLLVMRRNAHVIRDLSGRIRVRAHQGRRLPDLYLQTLFANFDDIQLRELDAPRRIKILQEQDYSRRLVIEMSSQDHFDNMKLRGYNEPSAYPP